MKYVACAAICVIYSIFLVGCPDSGSGGSSDGSSCPWLGNCASSMAPDGAYDCNGNSLVQCNNGKWESVASCGSEHNSNDHGRGCTCKGGCGTRTTECSYAFDSCGGHSYETCGPFAQAVITDKWRCVKNTGAASLNLDKALSDSQIEDSEQAPSPVYAN